MSSHWNAAYNIAYIYTHEYITRGSEVQVELISRLIVIHNVNYRRFDDILGYITHIYVTEMSTIRAGMKLSVYIFRRYANGRIIAKTYSDRLTLDRPIRTEELFALDWSKRHCTPRLDFRTHRYIFYNLQILRRQLAHWIRCDKIIYQRKASGMFLSLSFTHYYSLANMARRKLPLRFHSYVITCVNWLSARASRNDAHTL